MAELTAQLLRTSRQVLTTLLAGRGSPASPTERPMVSQIKADMTDIADFHHRQHHNDWLTVVDAETQVGTRYVCRCSGGYTVWVDVGNVTRRRQVPEPGPRPQADPATCGNKNPYRLS